MKEERSKFDYGGRGLSRLHRQWQRVGDVTIVTWRRSVNSILKASYNRGSEPHHCLNNQRERERHTQRDSISYPSKQSSVID